MQQRIHENKLPAGVVIGCTHHYKGCEHELHPSEDLYYTIDINPDFKPDLCLNILAEGMPENLHHQFKLSILEYLPYDVYNFNPYIMHSTRINGQNGLNNVRQITDKNGFILIVGNKRDLVFRYSLAELKYFEIAYSQDDLYILLIPNNQNLTASEALAELDKLPLELKKTIHTALSLSYKNAQKPYNPLMIYDYCNLNYRIHNFNGPLIFDLIKYVVDMNQKEESGIVIRFFDHKINLGFGFTKEERLIAANILIHVLLGNMPLQSFTSSHLDALKSDGIFEIIQRHLGNKSIKDFIDTTARTTHLSQKEPLLLLNLNTTTYKASSAQIRF